MQDNRPIVIEFGVPNLFKPMNFHHLRSLVTGGVFRCFFAKIGSKIISDLHYSDITTEHCGHILYYMFYVKPDAVFKDMTDVYDAYFWVKNAVKKNLALEDMIVNQIVNVQKKPDYILNDRLNIDQLFQRYVRKILLNLDIQIDYFGKESDYLLMTKKMIRTLLKENYAEKIDNSIVMKQLTKNRFSPLMLQFKDGRFLHSGIDLAVIYHRVNVFKAKKILYFITGKLTTQLSQLFAAAQQVGLDVELEHIKLGDLMVGSSVPIKNPDKLIKVVGRYNTDLDFLPDSCKKPFMYDVLKLQNVWHHPRKYITIYPDKLHESQEFQLMKSYVLSMQQYGDLVRRNYVLPDLDGLVVQCQSTYDLSPLLAACQEKKRCIENGISVDEAINFLHRAMDLLGLGAWRQYPEKPNTPGDETT